MGTDVLFKSLRGVEETIARISNDSKHHHVTIVEKTAIAKRSFANWNMGFHQVNDADLLTHPNYVSFFNTEFDANVSGIQPGLALRMLRDFAKQLGD
jgi:hypothetical protein